MNKMTGSLQRRLFKFLLLAVFSLAAQASDYMSPGLTPQQLLEKLDTDQALLVVDVRKPAEFGVAHIPGAVNIPLPEIEDRLDEFKHNNGQWLDHLTEGRVSAQVFESVSVNRTGGTCW